MKAKRGDRVGPPPPGTPGPSPAEGEWDLRFRTTAAAKGWEELRRQAPKNTRDAWRQMRHNPGGGRSARHLPLKGSLATKSVDGKPLPMWQYEITAGARVWYLIDTDQHTVWVQHAGTGHPKATD